MCISGGLFSLFYHAVKSSPFKSYYTGNDFRDASDRYNDMGERWSFRSICY